METLLTESSSSTTGEDFRLGVYRTRDPISHFRVRVRIRKVTPTPSPVAQASSSSSSSVAGSAESVRSVAVISDLIDEVTLGWQQKVFSRREVEFYAGKREEDFEGDVLGRKFFHDVRDSLVAREGVASVASVGVANVGVTSMGVVGMGVARRICTLVDGEMVKPADSDEVDDEKAGFATAERALLPLLLRHPSLAAVASDVPSWIASVFRAMAQ